ncbi:MFS transporter [Carnobacterium alterfunditum]|uniref:MFS transporter n=1 Tax=Carnobacterium alterfunditum TaxID=28230 RepID=UPI003593AE97
MEQAKKEAIDERYRPTEVSDKYWWKVVTLFTLGWALMYADRTILNPIMPQLALEFNLNNSQLGLINSVFFLTYAVTQIPFGVLGDKYGRKLVIAIGFILFGTMTLLSGLASGFGIFMIYRALTGAGQGTYYGPQYALSTESIPLRNRTFGNAIINSGMALGTSAGYILSSKLVLENGEHWSLPFFIMSIPTILIGILIFTLLKEKVTRPEDRKVSGTKEIVKEEKVKKVSIAQIFKNRNLVLTFIMCFCSLYGFFVVLTWLPQFLQVERGFEGTSVGFIASLVPWASIPGAILFARLSDRFKRTKIFVYTLVPIAMLSIFSIAFVTDRTLLIVALVLYGLTGKLALDPILVSFVAKNSPKGSLSTALSAYNFVGMSSSILAPYVTGWITDTVGSMQIGFYLSAGLLLVGMIFFSFTKENEVEAFA